MRELMIPTQADYYGEEPIAGLDCQAELYDAVDALHEAVEEALAIDEPGAEQQALRNLWS